MERERDEANLFWLEWEILASNVDSVWIEQEIPVMVAAKVREAITNPAIPGSDVPSITGSKDYVGGWASIHRRFIGSDVPIQLMIKWRRNLQLCWKPKLEHTRNHPATGVGGDSPACDFGVSIAEVNEIVWDLGVPKVWAVDLMIHKEDRQSYQKKKWYTKKIDNI